MSIISNNIWRAPAYLPYLQPALTPEVVAEVETTLGVRLPQAFIDLLYQQNGGYVRLTLPDSPHTMIWGIGPYFPNIGDEHSWQAPDAADEEPWLPDDPASLVPFDGDGHWHLCFDYRGIESDAEPGITYIDFELEEDRSIAPDFAQFLAMLREEISPDTFGITSDHSIQEAVGVLERAMTVTFEEPDPFAYGYPVYRCRVGNQRPPDWIWISVNEVPRGYVRRSDPRYSELVGTLPGTALQMPDHPDVKVIVSCTEGMGRRVREICVKAGVGVAALDGPNI